MSYPIIQMMHNQTKVCIEMLINDLIAYSYKTKTSNTKYNLLLSIRARITFWMNLSITILYATFNQPNDIWNIAKTIQNYFFNWGDWHLCKREFGEKFFAF